MRIGSWMFLAAVAVMAMFLNGCGGGDGGPAPPPTGGTVTGEIYGRAGGTFVPLGGQQVSIGNRTDISDPNTGEFRITGVPAGAFTVVVTPQAGYGEVLNPEILSGTVRDGQTVNIGRVLLGARPPDPAF
ncbi:MAG: hypothetical protein ACUVX8_00015 [Candidatus Zipacnadales bacterium]